jgi:hypothetical protein
VAAGSSRLTATVKPREKSTFTKSELRVEGFMVTTQQTENDVLFQETQTFRQLWLWALLLGVVSVAAVFLVAQMLSQPDKAALLAGPALVFFGVWAAVLVFLYVLKLTVTVDSQHLHVRFWPLMRKDIALADITQYEVRAYRPILEYGGWGLRYSWRGTAYNVSGNRGVQLVLAGGRRILIGSQMPEELAEAIARVKGL